MTVKDKIIVFLESNRGEYISGERLASELEVSRAAVWKAIKKLQTEGFAIEAVTNKGYMLCEDTDVLTANGVSALLTTKRARVEVYNEVTSTNLVLKDRTNEDEGLVIAAMHQTAGMGRLGRKFYSPSDTGIYFSILVKPTIDNKEVAMLTSLAAVSVCEAIEACTVSEAKIKWVNDVFIGDKKVCGILTQASFSMENFSPEYVIVGIGINVYPPEKGFGAELNNIAGAVFEEKHGNMKNKLLAYTVDSFFKYYDTFMDKDFVTEYKRRSYTVGKQVSVIKADKVKNGVALKIDDECRILVEYEDGERELIASGEVSVRPKDVI